MVSEVEDRIIGVGSGFEIEDYWKPGQKIRKMVSQPTTPPASVTPEIRILIHTLGRTRGYTDEYFRDLIVA